MATAIATHQIGKVVQVIGPVLDVEFESGHLPELYNALEINATTDSGQTIKVTVEVQQHVGRNQVRAVAMSSTDSVVRGMEVMRQYKDKLIGTMPPHIFAVADQSFRDMLAGCRDAIRVPAPSGILR